MVHADLDSIHAKADAANSVGALPPEVTALLVNEVISLVKQYGPAVLDKASDLVESWLHIGPSPAPKPTSAN